MVPDQREAVRALETLDEVLMQQVRARNPEKLVEIFYAEDAELLAPNQPGVVGRAKIIEFWRHMFELGLNKIILNTTHIDISGDLACAKGQYAFTFQRDGRVSHDKGKYLLTYRRQADGSWRVVAKMFSSDRAVS